MTDYISLSEAEKQAAALDWLAPDYKELALWEPHLTMRLRKDLAAQAPAKWELALGPDTLSRVQVRLSVLPPDRGADYINLRVEAWVGGTQLAPSWEATLSEGDMTQESLDFIQPEFDDTDEAWATEYGTPIFALRRFGSCAEARLILDMLHERGCQNIQLTCSYIYATFPPLHSTNSAPR